MTQAIAPATLADLRTARSRLAQALPATPLVRLDHDGDEDIWLKLENLQPIGSFKVRGAGNAMLAAGREALAAGVTTASAGNMAQGVAWWARRFGVRATALVPEHAPAAKTTAIERLGGHIRRVPFDDWWAVIEGAMPREPGLFIHPVADPMVIAGNGTIGLELTEALPAFDTVLVPFGGGGLSLGIASALAELRPGVPVVACEVETAAPLAASLAAGKPVSIPHTPSFVDGIGGKSVLPAMWPALTQTLREAAVVTLEAIAEAVRLLAARHRVVAEGAGAASVAAALAGHARGRTICVVSGGNIDPSVLARILTGHMPE